MSGFFQLEEGEDRRQAGEVFTELKTRLYADHPLAAAKLSEHLAGSYFRRWFILRRGGRALVQAVLFDNPGLSPPGQKTFMIGHYDSVDDLEASTFFLRAVEIWAAENAAERLIGPMNGSTWEDYRFGLDPQKAPFFTEPVHQPYYPEQFEKAGFTVLASYTSRFTRTLNVESSYLGPVQRRLDRLRVRIRNLDTDRWEEETERLHAFCQTVFRSSFLFTGVDLTDFRAKYEVLRHLARPGFIRVAQRAGQTVGLLLSLDDRYNLSEKGLIFKTIARAPGLEYAGLVHLMASSVLERARADGYVYAVHAFMHETNISENVSRRFVGEPYKKYALYIKRPAR